MNKTKKQLRQQKKQQLLNQIAQQRIDLSSTKAEWLHYTAPLDHYWQLFLKVRTVAFIGVSVMILTNWRNPSKIIKLSQTAMKAWWTTRIIQRSFHD